jgi:hypothetical protein
MSFPILALEVNPKIKERNMLSLPSSRRAFAASAWVMLSFAALSVHADTQPLAPPFQISADSEYLAAATTARAGNGNFIATWSALDRNVPSYGRLYRPDGTQIGGELELPSADVVYTQAVAMDKDGKFVFVWATGSTDSGYHVYARLYNADGTVRGPDIDVSGNVLFGPPSNILWYGPQPAVAMDANGDFVVAWNNVYAEIVWELSDFSFIAVTKSHDAVFARAYTADGAPRGAATAVQADSPQLGIDYGGIALGAEAPSVAMDANSNFVVAWTDYQHYLRTAALEPRALYARRFSADGQPRDLRFKLNSTPYADTPRIAAVADGSFVVAWNSAAAVDRQTGDVTGRQVNAQRYTATGKRSGGAVEVASGDDAMLKFLSADPAGNFVVSYAGRDSAGYQAAYAQRFAKDGTVQGAPLRLDEPGTFWSSNFAGAALDDESRLAAVWTKMVPADPASPQQGYFARLMGQLFSAP